MHRIQANSSKLIFLIGSDNDLPGALDEAKEFKDMLIGDFKDSFHNLTYKDSMACTWLMKRCNPEFVFKGDDDVLVNPWELQRRDIIFKCLGCPPSCKF